MPQRLLENVCTSTLDQCLARTHEHKFKCNSAYDYRTHKSVFLYKVGPVSYCGTEWGNASLLMLCTLICGPGSSVSTATDGPGSNPGGDDIFRPSRPALGPTQPPVKWVPRSFPEVKCGRGVLLTTHPLLLPRSWKSRAIPLPTTWATPGL